MFLFTGKKELATQLLGFSSPAPPPTASQHRNALTYTHWMLWCGYTLSGHLSAQIWVSSAWSYRQRAWGARVGMETAVEPSRENHQDGNSSWDHDISQICLLGDRDGAH